MSTKDSTPANKLLLDALGGRKEPKGAGSSYDRIGFFENNGTTNTEEILQTIPDEKGTAWQKYLQRKDILDCDDYDMIVEALVRSRLFQEGRLHVGQF